MAQNISTEPSLSELNKAWHKEAWHKEALEKPEWDKDHLLYMVAMGYLFFVPSVAMNGLCVQKKGEDREVIFTQLKHAQGISCDSERVVLDEPFEKGDLFSYIDGSRKNYDFITRLFIFAETAHQKQQLEELHNNFFQDYQQLFRKR